MTFTETLHKECDSCGKEAQRHRLTKSGVFYCLELNSSGENHYVPWNATVARLGGAVDITRIVYTCKVMYLKKSPLSKAMGKAIQGYFDHNIGALV